MSQEILDQKKSTEIPKIPKKVVAAIEAVKSNLLDNKALEEYMKVPTNQQDVWTAIITGQWIEIPDINIKVGFIYTGEYLSESEEVEKCLIKVLKIEDNVVFALAFNEESNEFNTIKFDLHSTNVTGFTNDTQRKEFEYSLSFYTKEREVNEFKIGDTVMTSKVKNEISLKLIEDASDIEEAVENKYPLYQTTDEVETFKF